MRNHKKSKNKYITSVLWLLTGLCVCASVVLAIEVSGYGAEINSLEKKEEVLANRTRELSEELVARSSLAKLEKQALELGFVKPKDFVYLQTEEFAVKIH